MPVEFGKMAPGYFELLCREADLEEVRYHYPAAAIQAALFNLKRDEDKKPEPFQPIDFIPGWELVPGTNEEALLDEQAAYAMALIKARVQDAERRSNNRRVSGSSQATGGPSVPRG